MSGFRHVLYLLMTHNDLSYWPWGWSPESSLADQKLPWDFLASLPREDTGSQPGNENLGMSVSVFLLLGMRPHKAEVNQG